MKLGRLVRPTLAAHARRPWRLLGPVASIMRSRGTKWMLEELRDQRILVFAVPGERDIAVPLSTAQAAAKRQRGDLLVVRGATPSWLLKDPATPPAPMRALQKGRPRTEL